MSVEHLYEYLAAVASVPSHFAALARQAANGGGVDPDGRLAVRAARAADGPPADALRALAAAKLAGQVYGAVGRSPFAPSLSAFARRQELPLGHVVIAVLRAYAAHRNRSEVRALAAVFGWIQWVGAGPDARATAAMGDELAAAFIAGTRAAARETASLFLAEAILFATAVIRVWNREVYAAVKAAA